MELTVSLTNMSTHQSSGFPRWMEREIRNANFVLMVCTETYYLRVMENEEPGKGLGVQWEGHPIYQHFYKEGT